MTTHSTSTDRPAFYGENCPKGMVQVEFVGCSPNQRYSDYGWKPVEHATIDIYIDGKRFYIEVGDFHDGRGQRRGLHIIGPVNMCVEHTSMNAASIFSPVG